MAAITTLGAFVTAIQGRSKTGVVYAVTPQPNGPTGGPFTITRNGLSVGTFNWPGIGPAAWTGLGNSSQDASSAVLFDFITVDGVSTKPNADAFILTLN
jgi:hypothetical protein